MSDFLSTKRGAQLGGLTLVRGGATFDLSPAEIRQVIVATGKLLVSPGLGASSRELLRIELEKAGCQTVAVPEDGETP